MASRSRYLAVLPVAAAAFAVGAILSEPLPIPAGYIGPVTGDPEKDTYGRGFAGRSVAQEAPRYSARPRQVGLVTGNPEKDTFGFVVLRGAGALASAD